MPWNCCVPQCSATSNTCKGLSFHSFPTNPREKKKWIISIRSSKTPSKYAKVCGRHFKESDFLTKKTDALENKRMLLKPGAFPELHLPVRSFEKATKLRKVPVSRTKIKETSIIITPTQEIIEEVVMLDDFNVNNEISIECSSTETPSNSIATQTDVATDITTADVTSQTNFSFNFWEDSVKNMKEDQYTCIIDCTEIEMEMPSNPTHQQVTWSEYKQRPTLKALIGISERGVVMFCSDLHGGSISDREIVKRSGILSLVKEGDIILADKGFNVSDLFEQNKAALNIPPFKYD
ncbi:uncharacterized protein LOC129220649 [Uloborus diversus]|uniref:uncharacterized protein LOC129220649 n=1 Tax=Uloborus diversus TaxID=327109 RepID=UPI00240A1967|nr:uncharacterized protein LOC129220649 [Uloborus diversus]